MTVLDINVYDPDRYAEGVPYADFKRLRAEAPVYRHPDPELAEGYWAVTRHADVQFVSRNSQIFSSYERTAMMGEFDGDALFRQQMIMLNMDDPEHTRLRGLVNRGFLPKMIQQLEERSRQICTELIGGALDKGDCDFVRMCAAELPLVMIAELMGVPQEDRHKLFEWSNRMVGFDDPEFQTTPQDGEAAAMEIVMYAHQLGAQKRNDPRDDIITKLISKDEAGNELSELEFDMFFILLSVAGNETTRNAMSGGMLAFIEHPDQWRRLQESPELIVTAVEEIVRWVTPVNQFRRTPMEDVEIGGQLIKKGEKVVVYYASANRDESVFENPDTFDIGRDPNPHVGYGGGGPHFCLGAHLARLELQTFFKMLAERVDHVELTAPARRLRSNFLNGIKEMPVRFVPAG